MNKKPDFIGIGGGRSGTRWVSMCLYEHPQVWLSVGEPHFFSREKNWSKGWEWYESMFAGCPNGKITGEISNSYLADPETAKKIKSRYPDIKLMVIFRNPVERAFSCYLNDIKAGIISKNVQFLEAIKNRGDYYVNEGQHATNIKRYLEIFPKHQILMLIYDDIAKDPLSFIRTIYQFLGINQDFKPSYLNRKVNIGRVPHSIALERFFINLSRFIRTHGFHWLWWLVKKTGFTEILIKLNTKAEPQLIDGERRIAYGLFKREIIELEEVLGYKLEAWHLNEY